MKSFLLCILIQCSILSMAQEKKISFPVNIKESASAFNAVDQESGNFSIFTKDGRKIQAMLFSEDLEELGGLNISGISSRREILTASFSTPTTVNLLIGNQGRTKFETLIIDFENNTSSSEKQEFRLRNEGFIGALGLKENFLLLSVPIGSNTIRAYDFQHGETPVVVGIDFKEQEFLNQYNRKSTISELFTNPEDESFLLTGMIDPKKPATLGITSRKVKFYPLGKEWLISLDGNKHFTYLLSIDPENYHVVVRTITKPQMEEPESSNSFLFENKLFQVVSSKKQLKFHIFDLETEELLNAFAVKENEIIPFKNTRILQEGKDSNEETSRFLRKMSNNTIAVTTVKKDQHYEVSIGTPLNPEEEESKGATDFFMVGAMLNNIEDFSYQSSVGSYAFSRSLKITGLFDERFQHMEGTPEPGIIDRIRNFAESLENLGAETFLKIEDRYYWGNYDKKEREYALYQF